MNKKDIDYRQSKVKTIFYTVLKKIYFSLLKFLTHSNARKHSFLSSNFNFKISFGDTLKKFYRKMLNRYCVPLSDFKVCMYWCAGHFKIYISKYWQIHKYGWTSSSSKKEYWFVSKGQINNGNKHKSCTFFSDSEVQVKIWLHIFLIW